MRLAQADPAVQEKRVIRFAGRLGDGERGGMGEVVIVADHETVKSIFWIEPGFGGNFFRGTFGHPGRFDGRGDRGRIRESVGGDDLEFDVHRFGGGAREHVLKQTHIIILEPDFAKIVGHLEDDRIIFQGMRPERREPKIERVGAQHGA